MSASTHDPSNPDIAVLSPDAVVEKLQASPSARLIRRPLLAPLLATKRAGARSVRAGRSVRFYMRVHNPSKRTATDVRVCDSLPRGLTVVSARGARASSRRACWSVGTLAVGQAKRFSLVARAGRGAGGRVRNVVAVSAARRPTVQSSATVAIRPAPPPPSDVTG